jgi:hypothetical protein
MSLFVNCEWRPPAGAGIHARIEQVGRLLARDETIAIVGPSWYRLGRSKKQALSKPVPLAELGKVGSWKREWFAPGEDEYSLGMWNGRDDPHAVSLLVYLHEPPTMFDTLLFDGPNLDSVKEKWRDVLAWGEAVAHQLGGLSVVSSGQLQKWAEAEGIDDPVSAAYAVFWGQDAASKPRTARGAGSIVSAATWPEVIAPNRGRMQELIAVRTTQGSAP